MMDKAKAYDEALEKARQDRDAYQKELDKIDKNSQLASILRAGISALEMVFPQLKDSDDERIRKQLVDIVAFIPEANFKSASREDCRTYLEKQKECVIDNTSEDEKMLQTIIQGFKNWKVNGMERFNGTKIDDILAYLEKQKYNRMQPVYDNQESFESALDKAWKAYNDCGSRTVDSCEDDYIESAYAKGFREGYLFGLEKQKEQKPVDDKAFEEWIDDWWKHNKVNNHKGNEIQFDEQGFKTFCRRIKNMYQQKSDWNEEDEMMRENIISDLQYFRDCATDKEAVSDYDDEINWLKDIFLDHKKFTEAVEKLWSNEWSEEDEKRLKRVLEIVDKHGTIPVYDGKVEKRFNAEYIWLKYLPKRFVLQSKQEWNEEDEKDIADIIEILDDCYASGRHDLSKINHENLVNKLKSLYPSQKSNEEPEYYQHFDPNC